MDRLAAARLKYAEEIGALAKAGAAVVDAFAAVPREQFVGAPPWTLRTMEGASQTGDPFELYKNVLVVLDADKQLNNGQPSLWALLFEHLGLRAGERVIHVGAGTGYYTAILAQMVGPAGQVTGIEFEPDLAAQAKAALAGSSHVEILTGDAFDLVAGPADVIVASCGFDAPPIAWVEALNDRGRLMAPLTVTMGQWSGGGAGAMLLVTRRGERFAATWSSTVVIYSCMSGRTETANARLAAAFRLPHDRTKMRDWRPPPIASLRLSGAPDESCRLQGAGWWLSTRAA